MHPSICVLMASALVTLWCSCGGNTCGKGTVEVDGVCVAANDFLKCGPGFKVVANECLPLDEWKKTACNPANTSYNPATGLCDGVGGGPTCTKVCQPASGSKICISGQVFEGVSYLMNGQEKATPIKPAEDLLIRLFDPIEFISNPNAQPLAKTTIYNDNGCYIIENVTIPVAGFFAVGVDDANAANDLWGWTSIGVIPTPGQNTTDQPILALSRPTLSAWGNDLEKVGTMVLWYRDAQGRNVEGVTPLLEGAEPPFAGATLFFFGDDLVAGPVFKTGATQTGKLGVVGLRPGPFKSAYSGKKGSCTIESGPGASVPNVVFFRPLKVEGC